MAYDPTTGEWKDEEVDTSKRMTDLLSKDSDYMRQATAVGEQGAHRRGLLNSTMAIQSGEAARLSAALPIASQDASQANSRVMQGRQLQSTDVTQKRGLASNEALTREGYGLQRELASGDIASRERMQGRDIEAGKANLERELGSREKLQLAQSAAEKERLGMQLTAQEKLALQDLQAAERRLGIDIESREKMQTRELENDRWSQQFDAATRQALQGIDIESRERMQKAGFTQEQVLQQADINSRELMQSLDNDTRKLMQGLDIETQLRIESMKVDASDRADATRLAATFEATYAGMLESIMNNPDIPADVRQTYMNTANKIRESNIAMIEQMYGIDLQWDTPGTEDEGE